MVNGYESTQKLTMVSRKNKKLLVKWNFEIIVHVVSERNFFCTNY